MIDLLNVKLSLHINFIDNIPESIKNSCTVKLNGVILNDNYKQELKNIL